MKNKEQYNKYIDATCFILVPGAGTKNSTSIFNNVDLVNTKI